MIRSIFFLLLCSIALNASSQEDEEKGKTFIGGMLLHSGNLSNSRTQDNISGLCTGIGGQISFFVGKHFRIGTEGYASSFSYSENDGHYKLGWGGLLVAYQIGVKKLKPVVSLTFGGGKIKDLYFVSGSVDDDDIDDVRYRVFSDFLISPSLSLEYSLKSNLNLIFKTDYILPVSSSNPNDYAYGPRLYVGILFTK